MSIRRGALLLEMLMPKELTLHCFLILNMSYLSYLHLIHYQLLCMFCIMKELS
jgi:hypothetical protein